MKNKLSVRSEWERSTTRRCLNWFLSWRTLRRALLVVAGFGTLVALFYAVENWRGARAWDQHRRSLEVRGESIELAELIPPPVPQEQNLALAPVLQPIFDYTRSATGLVWNQLEARERLSAAFGGSGKVMNVRDGPGSIEKGTFTDLEVCWREWPGKEPTATAGNAVEAAEQLLGAMQEASAILDGLAQAAVERPQTRFPVEYGWEPSFEILLPHLGQMKGLQGAAVLRAIARLELGQSREAFSDLQLGFRLADAVRGEPILISQLVRVAMVGRNLQVIREGLHRRAWTPDELIHLQRQLEGLDLLAGFELAQQGERAMTVGAIDYLRRLGPRMNFLELAGDDSPLPVDLMLGCMPDGWYYRNMLLLSQLHEGYRPVLDVAAQRVHPKRGAAHEARLDQFNQSPTRPGNVLVKILMPNLVRGVVRPARVQTYADAARVAIALERYRLDHGRIPSVLGELVPEYIEAIPHDLIDGEELRYLPGLEGDYRIYSVGWNETDDGGTLAWTKKGGSSVDETRGDWVWTMPEGRPALGSSHAPRP